MLKLVGTAWKALLIGWAVVVINALWHAPAAAQAPKLSLELAAQVKFPGVPTKNLAVLLAVNRAVNKAITYTSDTDHYGKLDNWVMNPVDGKGDCEDYVLTKLDKLGDLGFPILTHSRVRFVFVGLAGHAILELRMPETGAIMFLDNGYDDLMTRAELEARGYRFFDW